MPNQNVRFGDFGDLEQLVQVAHHLERIALSACGFARAAPCTVIAQNAGYAFDASIDLAPLMTVRSKSGLEYDGWRTFATAG
jgi:hypothetical protein